MSKQERFNKLMDGLNLLQRSDAGTARRNSIPITVNTSDAHWWAVTHLAREFVNQGMELVCEARFQHSKLRADIYLPEIKVVIEVLASEDEKSLLRKVDEYAKKGIRVGWITTTEYYEYITLYAMNAACKELCDLAVTRAGKPIVEELP